MGCLRGWRCLNNRLHLEKAHAFAFSGLCPSLLAHTDVLEFYCSLLFIFLTPSGRHRFFPPCVVQRRHCEGKCTSGPVAILNLFCFCSSKQSAATNVKLIFKGVVLKLRLHCWCRAAGARDQQGTHG